MSSWFCAVAPPMCIGTGARMSRSRSTSASVASLSGDSSGVTTTSVFVPSRDGTPGVTAFTPGNGSMSEATKPSTSVPSNTSWIGPSAPSPPSCCAASSKPTRVSKSSGNIAIAAVFSFSTSAGEAIRSMSAVAASANGSGRRISIAVQRSQNPGPSLGLGLGLMRPMIFPGRATRCPSAAISAGSSVTAAITAMPTTTIAPTAIDCTTFASIRNSPASATITVTPENVTAMPDVRIATSRASAGSARSPAPPGSGRG